MRAIVLASLLAAVTSAPADACPRPVTCAVIDLRPAVDLPLPSPRPLRDPVQLAFRFEVESRPEPDPMPWIWQVLVREVYGRLPTYAEDRRFTLTLAPVVVATAVDTVPGIGVEGEF